MSVHSSSEYGLGNRVNSIVSAATVASVLGETATFSWPQSPHLRGESESLFQSLPAAKTEEVPNGARVIEVVNLDDDSLPFSLPSRRAEFLRQWPIFARQVVFSTPVLANVPTCEFAVLHIRANIARSRAVAKNRLLRKSKHVYDPPTAEGISRACRPFSKVFVACDNPEIKALALRTLGSKALWFDGVLESEDKQNRSAENAFAAAVDMAAMCSATAIISTRPGYSTIRTLPSVGFGVPMFIFNPYRVV